MREGPETAPLGIAITAASSVLMPIIAAGKKRIGRRIGNRASIGWLVQHEMGIYVVDRRGGSYLPRF